MSNVNLIPEELKALRGRRRTRRLGLLGGVLALVLFGGLGWLFWGRLEALERRLEQATVAYEACRPALAKQAELDTVREELTRKRGFVAQARGDATWSDFLEMVDASVPNGVALHEADANGRTLVVKGSAPDLVEVARFMSGLWESGRFGSVEVVFPVAFPSPQPAVGAVEFVVTAALAPGGAQ